VRIDASRGAERPGDGDDAVAPAVPAALTFIEDDTRGRSPMRARRTVLSS